MSTPPQDSDAEIDELFIDVAVRSANQYGGFEEWETPEEREEVIGKAKQALLALKARWEAEARIDELRILWPRFTDIQVNGTNGPDDNPAARKCIDNRLATLQNQLPTKETK